MALKLTRKPKRKAGTRAGLTRATIAAKAAEQLEIEPDKFSLRDLARRLDVVPTSIRSHFDGGVSELFDEVVKAALEDIARPYQPKEEAADYLADLFFAILESLHGKPRIAVLAIQQLTANPILFHFWPNGSWQVYPRSGLRKRRLRNCSRERLGRSAK